jgi:hypothetical protein
MPIYSARNIHDQTTRLIPSPKSKPLKRNQSSKLMNRRSLALAEQIAYYFEYV